MYRKTIKKNLNEIVTLPILLLYLFKKNYLRFGDYEFNLVSYLNLH